MRVSSKGITAVAEFATTVDVEFTVREGAYSDEDPFSLEVYPSWLTTWIITARSETGFSLEFGEAAHPGASIEWKVISNS